MDAAFGLGGVVCVREADDVTAAVLLSFLGDGTGAASSSSARLTNDRLRCPLRCFFPSSSDELLLSCDKSTTSWHFLTSRVTSTTPTGSLFLEQATTLVRFDGLTSPPPSLWRFLEVNPKAAREGARGWLPIFLRGIVDRALGLSLCLVRERSVGVDACVGWSFYLVRFICIALEMQGNAMAMV